MPLQSDATKITVLAGFVSLAGFFSSFLAVSYVYYIVNNCNDELDVEMTFFKTNADNLWTDIVELSHVYKRTRRTRGSADAYPHAPQPPSDAYNQLEGAGGSISAPSHQIALAPSGPIPDAPNACQCNAVNKCHAGPRGPKGGTGLPGPDGIPGVDGKPGGDADDVMLDTNTITNCFTCMPGAPGSPGPKGRPGQRGPKGANGATGRAGKDGQPGPPGEMGAEGPVGKPGPDGRTGEKGLDGRKPIGRRGPKGLPGEVGSTGAQGAPGADGPRGPAGPRGTSGPPGGAGAAGRVGPTGDEGAVGRPGRDAEYCHCPERRTTNRLLKRHRFH